MKFKWLVIVGLLFVLLTSSFTLYGAEMRVLDLQKMRVDLEYLRSKIEDIHPNPYHAISKAEYQELWEEIYQSLEEPTSLEEFYFLVQKALYPLHDAHSAAHIMGRNILPVELVWLEEGLYISNDYAPFKKGDQILAIGGVAIEQIYDTLEKMLSAENQYWVKHRAESHLREEFWLKHLDLINNGTVGLTVKDAQGVVQEHQITPIERVFTKSVPYEYTLKPEANLAIFTLNVCNNDEQYSQFLAEFFAKVREAKITRIAIDVRNNGGGNSTVIDEFLSYTTVKKYKGFSGRIKMSKQAIDHDGFFKVLLSQIPISLKTKIKSKNVELYDGELYVLTGKGTFSSANWFAVIVQDNQLGQVIGEPTGNAPSSYGYPLGIRLPYSKIYVQISHVRWIRPDRSKNAEDACYPDVLVPVTAKDLREVRDPVLEWFVK